MDLETLQLMDEKLEKCRGNCSSNDKELKTSVDDKIGKTTFFWIMGISYSIIAAIVGVLYGRISTIEQRNNDVYFNLSNRLTAIETNTANTSKQIEQLQQYFAQFDIKVSK